MPKLSKQREDELVDMLRMFKPANQAERLEQKNLISIVNYAEHFNSRLADVLDDVDLFNVVSRIRNLIAGAYRAPDYITNFFEE